MQPLRVGITHGDINGIGYELILKMLSAPEMLEICTPVIFGSSKAAAITAKTITVEQHVNLNICKHAGEVLDGRANLINVCNDDLQIEWGQNTEASLQAEAASLNAALESWKNGDIDMLVCAPGQLDNGIDNHPLSDFIRKALNADSTEFDWVINGKTRTLKLLPYSYTTELGEGMAHESLKNNLTSISAQLRQDFGQIRPRIALLSSDPKLDTDLRDLREQGTVIFGMFEPEEFLEKQMYQHYDGVLFLEQEESRHELIKKLEASHTFGYVAGLPLVLTYALLPVSYELAGKDMCNETPLRYAVYEAIDIFRSRERYAEATYKPLEKHWIPKGRDDFKLDLTKEE